MSIKILDLLHEIDLLKVKVISSNTTLTSYGMKLVSYLLSSVTDDTVYPIHYNFNTSQAREDKRCAWFSNTLLLSAHED